MQLSLANSVIVYHTKSCTSLYKTITKR